MAAAKDEFVTILELSDPVHAEIIRDVLAQEGILATIPGSMHSSMLGAAGRAFLQIRVQVPASRAAEARAIVDALEEYDEVLPDGEEGAAISAEEMERRLAREDAEAEEGEGPYRRGPIVEPGYERRTKRVAIFCGLALSFGAAHFYARESGPALGLLIAEVLLFGFAIAGYGAAILGVPLLVLIDVWGAMRAIDRQNARRSTGTRGT